MSHPDSDRVREREEKEEQPYKKQAERSGKNVTFIAKDGCEVTITPDGKRFFNWSDWY